MQEEKSYFVHESSIIDKDSFVGKGTKIWHWCHISANCKIGSFCNLGQNIYIGESVEIGDFVKVQNNVSIYSNVVLEDYVFCGPSVVFTNVFMPRSFISRKDSYTDTLVKKGATLGANSTIICGNIIGEYSFVAAGSVITKNVLPFALVMGNPARHVGWISKYAEKIDLPLTGFGKWCSPSNKDTYTLKDGMLLLDS